LKTILIAASALAAFAPMAMPAPALALDHGRGKIRKEHKECSRELRRADSYRKFNREFAECQREISRAERKYHRDHRRGWSQYRDYDWNRHEPGFDGYYADRYYRDGSYYADRQLTEYDRIYRGYDGRYYCRRDDGTTGLIIGAGIGALLGNQVNIGGSRSLSTILGGAAGAAIGHEIDRGGVRCD
jgi:hypothetical protein